MLLSSLGGTEVLLGLPPNLRVLAIPDVEPQRDMNISSTEKRMIFEGGAMAMLTNDHLYKTLEKQAKRLRRQKEEVEELLRC
jgi:hypothetical protein